MAWKLSFSGASHASARRAYHHGVSHQSSQVGTETHWMFFREYSALFHAGLVAPDRGQSGRG